jgi:hypothetical protein
MDLPKTKTGIHADNRSETCCVPNEEGGCRPLTVSMNGDINPRSGTSRYALDSIRSTPHTSV